jgi:hypothetical protein
MIKVQAGSVASAWCLLPRWYLVAPSCRGMDAAHEAEEMGRVKATPLIPFSCKGSNS